MKTTYYPIGRLSETWSGPPALFVHLYLPILQRDALLYTHCGDALGRMVLDQASEGEEDYLTSMHAMPFGDEESLVRSLDRSKSAEQVENEIKQKKAESLVTAMCNYQKLSKREQESKAGSSLTARRSNGRPM